MTTLADVRRLFDAATFSRGLGYARGGHVLEIAGAPDDLVRARVRGSGGAVYRLEARLARRGARGLGLGSVCECPVGARCKHVAAALVVAVERGAPPRPVAPASAAPAPALPPALRSWLAALAEADRPPEPERTGYPDTVRDRLLYLLHPGDGRRLSLALVKATLRKDGSFGASPRPYDPTRINWETPPKFILPVDRWILRRIDQQGLRHSAHGYAYPAPPTEPGATMETLARVAETGRGRLGEADGPVLRLGPPRDGAFLWRAGADGAQRLVLTDAAERPLVLLPIDPPACLDPETGEIGPVALPVPPAMARALAQAPAVPVEAAAMVAEAFGRLATARPPAPRAMRAETRAGVRPVPVLRLHALQARRRVEYWESVAPTVEIAALRLAFDYAGVAVPAEPRGGKRADPRLREGDAVVIVQRDGRAEDAALDRLAAFEAMPLRDLGLDARGAGRGDFAFPDPDRPDDRALAFAAEALPQLRAEGWRIEIDPSWPYRLHDGPVDIRATVAEGDGGWFSVGLTLVADGQSIEIAPLIAAIIAALPLDAEGRLAGDFDPGEFLEDMVLYQRLPDGRHVALTGERLAPLVEACLAARHLFDGAHMAEAAPLRALAEALAGCGVPFSGGAALLELADRLRALAAAPMAEPPAALTATLRPYQKTGYGWLKALAETGFGGVLADDMGLGKTVQTLALLADRHLAAGSDRPSLLVAPTSLVGTWVAEAARFAPGLRVLALHGPRRAADFDRIGAAHLVVSTYPLLHRDLSVLKAQAWDAVVLDEAQAVKNPSSAVARHIRALEGRMRLALTGTPLENSLEDLWALYDWLIPGLLGDRKGFRAAFRTPIERDGDAAAQARLNARVRPFLLRRTKGDVAADLPDKTEITDLVALGERQRALYETIRATMDARVRAAIAARGLAASRITILDALLKLRQVCCDPGLLKDPAAAKAGSAKRARLMALLEELLAEGRRVLVFSQFVAMLRLIEADVTARGWRHAWLSGETKDRDGAVAAFQQGDAPLFLISLKAGGVGLTLTAADTVILYDPWWNPAVERQAMDRAHRIGQRRAVFVHRLVAEGTVEQAIVTLQARKQAMADALFEGKASGPLALDEDDLALLFGATD
ncbi:DEAD/DEAH box helicase [Rubrimonas sp.]|uniref:DEAD/DEAH box helicase n=1 Tax=Rubrimonas sp. TaxID=2036015 RepID=UPI002FDD592C